MFLFQNNSNLWLNKNASLIFFSIALGLSDVSTEKLAYITKLITDEQDFAFGLVTVFDTLSCNACLGQIVASDDSWCHHNELESKRQSM